MYASMRCMHVRMCVYMYVCVCVYVCMYVCMYVCICTYVRMHVCMYPPQKHLRCKKGAPKKLQVPGTQCKKHKEKTA